MELAMHTRILLERRFANPATDDELIKKQPMTSASSIRIIGAVYADRFARRGNDLVLVVATAPKGVVD
jgi:hypothetical protein